MSDSSSRELDMKQVKIYIITVYEIFVYDNVQREATLYEPDPAVRKSPFSVPIDRHS